MDALEEKGRKEAGIDLNPVWGHLLDSVIYPGSIPAPRHSLLIAHPESPLALFNLPRDAPEHTLKAGTIGPRSHLTVSTPAVPPPLNISACPV